MVFPVYDAEAVLASLLETILSTPATESISIAQLQAQVTTAMGLGEAASSSSIDDVTDLTTGRQAPPQAQVPQVPVQVPTMEPHLPPADVDVRLWMQDAAPDQNDPYEHVCPVTRMTFENPVQASDGFVYEENAIRRVMAHTNISPMTREVLTAELVPRTDIKEIIALWKAQAAQHWLLQQPETEVFPLSTPPNDSDDDDWLGGGSNAPNAPARRRYTRQGAGSSSGREVRYAENDDGASDGEVDVDDRLIQTREALTGLSMTQLLAAFPLPLTVSTSSIPDAGLGLFNYSGSDVHAAGVPLALVSDGPVLESRPMMLASSPQDVVRLPGAGHRFQTFTRHPDLTSGNINGGMANHAEENSLPRSNAALVVVHLYGGSTVTVLVSIRPIYDGDEVRFDVAAKASGSLKS
jgi:hypothetical protein